jgi:ATP-dependent helicase/DNAse subunit B
MKFDMKPQDKAFVKLAQKVAAGKSSSKDQVELESMMRQNPELREEFSELQRNLLDEKTADFWAVAVRVMVGTASKKEAKQIESLRTENPKQWEKYQDAVDFLDAMASRHEAVKDRKIEPMPPDVRKELLRQLSLDKPEGE